MPNSETSDFANVYSMRIFSGDMIILDDVFLNKFVFFHLQTIDINYSTMLRIENGTFRNLNKLRGVLLTIENYKSFIQSSDNFWMSELNSNVQVDYNDPVSVANNKNRSLLITFDGRYDLENYIFPSEDLKYFQRFPHEQFVFARVYSSLNLNCSDTLLFLFKNSKYYSSFSSVNTTIYNKCFQNENAMTTNDVTSTESEYETTGLSSAEDNTSDQTSGQIISTETNDYVETTSKPNETELTSSQYKTTIGPGSSTIIIAPTTSEHSPSTNKNSNEAKTYSEEEFLATALSLSLFASLNGIGLVYFGLRYYLVKSNLTKFNPESYNLDF